MLTSVVDPTTIQRHTWQLSPIPVLKFFNYVMVTCKMIPGSPCIYNLRSGAEKPGNEARRSQWSWDVYSLVPTSLLSALLLAEWYSGSQGLLLHEIT